MSPVSLAVFHYIAPPSRHIDVVLYPMILLLRPPKILLNRWRAVIIIFSIILCAITLPSHFVNSEYSQLAIASLLFVFYS